MGIPVKGSRVVVYNGKSYRYLVKVKPISGHLDQRELCLTIQENVKNPGNVIQFIFDYYTEITPALVVSEIDSAIKQGWNPSARNSKENRNKIVGFAGDK